MKGMWFDLNDLAYHYLFPVPLQLRARQTDVFNGAHLQAS